MKKQAEQEGSRCVHLPPVSDARQSDEREAAESLFKKGVQSLHEGKAVQATQYLEEAARNCPALPNVRYALATAYAQLGDIFPAQKACKMELAVAPDNRGAAELLERIERAVEEYRHSLMT